MTKETLNHCSAPADLVGGNGLSITLASCEGCLAATSDFFCDLGAKTVIVWKEQGQKGARPLQSCPRPEGREDYLIEHLKRI